MPSIEIETYKVTSYIVRFPGETRPVRVLELVSPVLSHSIQNRVTFGFSPIYEREWSSPVAGYLTDGGYSGLSIVGWFPLTEFQYYYDLARSERPLYVQYEFREQGSTTGLQRLIGLGTSSEPIGEGPQDPLEGISVILDTILNRES